ncbi:hypothetical protein DPMN_184711 [Dreissena polymorpha]|uniref:Uncharacterized protein n=1 Tax=Dreissena polymorpha TaxID=45954 RepID=A0A9D4I846_DREPO|nr:hypothetical protein DPMN_184711 [Dreissena polymorpha]
MEHPHQCQQWASRLFLQRYQTFPWRASPNGAYDSHHFIKSGATTPGNTRGTIQLSSRDITLSKSSICTPNFRTN